VFYTNSIDSFNNGLIANSFTEFINKLFEIKYDGKGNFVRRYQDGTVTVTPE